MVKLQDTHKKGIKNREKRCCCCLATKLCQTLATPWTAACQVPLSMEFCRHKHWSRLPFGTSGELPNSGIKPSSLVSLALAGEFLTISTTREKKMSYKRMTSKLTSDFLISSHGNRWQRKNISQELWQINCLELSFKDKGKIKTLTEISKGYILRKKKIISKERDQMQ